MRHQAAPGRGETHLPVRRLRNPLPLLLAAAFGGLILLAGCDTADTADPADTLITDVVITPSTTTLAPGEQFQFSAVAVNAQGEEVNTEGMDIDWEWWSTDPSVFTVAADGTALAIAPGEEYCIVAMTVNENLIVSSYPARGDGLLSAASAAAFTGRDSAVVFVF
jgi:hypothetical protein